MKSKMRLLAATLLAAAAPLALAQTTGGTGTGGTTTGGTSTGGTVATTPNPGQTLVATKIASNFTNLAGSQDNALALVNALRSGTDVTLTSTVPPPEGSTEPPTTTTFTPPTGKMGWGEVKNALAIAQASLAKAGVTNPTAGELQAALVGGDVTVTHADGTTTTTTLKGVLTMRSDGMGWGNIAKANGTKLGAVVSKVKMGKNTSAATTTTSTAAGDAAPLTGKSKGITTAAGSSSAASSGSSKGITTATGASSGAPGLVTAEGAGSNAGGNGKGNAFGRGIVTAGGGSAAAVTTATNHAGGNGNGNAGGNGKGNGKGAGPGG